MYHRTEFFFQPLQINNWTRVLFGRPKSPNPPVVFHIKLWYNPSPWMIKIGWNLPRISHQPWWYSVATSNTGLGIDVPLCFTSPNYEGDISTPTDIWFGDRNKIPKKGHQSQPQLKKPEGNNIVVTAISLRIQYFWLWYEYAMILELCLMLIIFSWKKYHHNYPIILRINHYRGKNISFLVFTTVYRLRLGDATTHKLDNSWNTCILVLIV